MDLFGEPEPSESAEAPAAPIELSDPELFTHPRSMPFCEGQNAVENMLLELFNSGRMPHGLIFSGTKGIGKATVAYRLARFLFKQGAPDPNQAGMFDDLPAEAPTTLDIDPDDPVFRRVASGGHPDLLTLEREYDAAKNKTKETLAVAALRKVEPFLRMTASEGGWRVVIIDDADTMNRNAQNALLKILEEPPKNTVIILIAHRAGALIPTIRSRARTIAFDALSPEIITDLLTQNGHYIDPYQGETLAALAQGSFGQAQSILEDGGLDILTQITQHLESQPKFDYSQIHPLADTLARAGNEKDYKSFTTTLLWLYKTMSFAKARGRALTPDALNTEPLNTILANSSLARLLEICENLSEHFDTTQRANLDKKQAVLGAFQIIAA